MASRRWIDLNIILKVVGGLIMMGLPVLLWFGSGRVGRGPFIVGLLGVWLFLWGLMAIGDSNNEWE